MDFMNIEIPKNARIKRIKRTHRKKEKYPGRGGGGPSREGPGQEIAQKTTTNEPGKNPTATAKKDAKIQEVENAVDSVTFAEQSGKEPESKESAGNGNNNNNSNITPKKDQTPSTNKKTTKSPDHRKTCFFPSPKSSNATIAAAEDHKRQLNVHGLPSEFMGPTAGGGQDNALYQLFRKLRQEKIGELGIDIKHII